MPVSFNKLLIDKISITLKFSQFSVAERPRALPRICPCQNGGYCMENEEGELVCDCLKEFTGKNCEKFLGQQHSAGGSNTAAILVPILILVLIGAAVGSWYIIKKRPL